MRKYGNKGFLMENLDKISFRLDFQSRKSLTIKCVASIYDVYYKEVKLTIRKLREVLRLMITLFLQI